MDMQISVCIPDTREAFEDEDDLDAWRLGGCSSFQSGRAESETYSQTLDKSSSVSPSFFVGLLQQLGRIRSLWWIFS